MTPEEIQRMIEGVLSVQRELQNSQLRLQKESQRQREDISTLVQRIGQLVEVSNRHERRIEQLTGYSITGESDRLDLQQQIEDLQRRVERLENQNN
jgi:chromosome segregation ATPase